MAVGPNVFNCPRCKEQVFVHIKKDEAWHIAAQCNCQGHEMVVADIRFKGLCNHVQEFWDEFLKKLPKTPATSHRIGGAAAL